MDWQERLNRAIGYIEGSLEGDCDLARAAALANCSAFHFYRMFEVVTGMGPAEYLRARRLSKAAIELAAGEGKVVDVALKCGYETPEAFAKAFKRLFGMSPTEARAPGAILSTYPPIAVSVVLKGAKPMKYRIVESGPIPFMGVKRLTDKDENEEKHTIKAFWDEKKADGTNGALCARSDGSGMYGACFCVDLKMESIDYMIAVKDAKPELPLPQGWCRETLPAGPYAVFESLGPMPRAIMDTWKRAFGEWFPGSGYEHAGSPDFEFYPDFPPGDPRGDYSAATCYTEVWIPIRKAK